MYIHIDERYRGRSGSRPVCYNCHRPTEANTHIWLDYDGAFQRTQMEICSECMEKLMKLFRALRDNKGVSSAKG